MWPTLRFCKCILYVQRFAKKLKKKPCKEVEWYSSVKSSPLTLYHTIPTVKDPEKEAFWKHCGKRKKNVGNKHFSHFSFAFSINVFYPSQKEFSFFNPFPNNKFLTLPN